MTNEEIKEIIENHQHWLKEDCEGWENIKRGLRAEIKKRENEQYFTFQCNVRQMCKDVLAKLEEQESEIAELKQEIKRLKQENEMSLVGINLRSPTSDGRFE